LKIKGFATMSIDRNYIKLIFWLLVVAVLVISSWPGSASSPSIQHLDKLVHFAAFFILTSLLLFGYTFRKPLLIPALIMALFGILIEVIQIFVPYRVFSMPDFVTDLFGIMLALLLFRNYSRKFGFN